MNRPTFNAEQSLRTPFGSYASSYKTGGFSNPVGSQHIQPAQHCPFPLGCGGVCVGRCDHLTGDEFVKCHSDCERDCCEQLPHCC